MKKLRGVFTAMVTPFDDQGNLDEEGLYQNLMHQLEGGVDGLVPLGTTGEAPTLSREEQERVVNIVIKEAKGKLPIIVGTGSYSTKTTIENTLKAEEMGADYALIVSPYYNKPTQEGLYRHFTTIANATSLPIIVYNIQGRTGQNIQTDTLKRIADHPRIVGVKEASGSIAQIGEVIEMIVHQRPDFCVLSGDDANTLPLMALGGHGIISVISNLVPKQVKALVQAIERGDYDLAREMHYQMMPLVRGAFLETNPMPIKAAMSFCGMAAGECRLPLCDLSAENQKKLHAILQKLNYGQTQHSLR